jgi:hypothetical protein
MLSTGLSKRGKHKSNKTTCDVPANNMSKLSVAHDEIFGSIVCTGDVHTIDKLVPRQHRSTDTCIRNSTDTSISNNDIITSNINKFSTKNVLLPPWISQIQWKIIEWKRFQLANLHEFPHSIVTGILPTIKCRLI